MLCEASLETLWNDEQSQEIPCGANSLLTRLLHESNDSEAYEDVHGLSRDMHAVVNQPHLCDVVFLVGEEKTPIYGVKAILALRSRVFYDTFYPQEEANNGSASAQKSSMNRLQRAIFDTKAFACMTPPAIVSESNDNPLTTVHVTEFDALVFKQLIQFLHEGSVKISCRSALGVMYAADELGLEELRLACVKHANDNLSPATAIPLIQGALHYLHDEFIISVVDKLLEFVDFNAEESVRSVALQTVPLSLFSMILTRPTLRLPGIDKFWNISDWLDANTDVSAEDAHKLIMAVDYSQIASKVLMKEVRPKGIVPDSILVQAICMQETGLVNVPVRSNLQSDIKMRFGDDIQNLYERIKQKGDKKSRRLCMSASPGQETTRKSFSSRMHSLNLSARRIKRCLNNHYNSQYSPQTQCNTHPFEMIL